MSLAAAGRLLTAHMCDCGRYQDYQAKDIPVVERGGARVRVMAGESSDATGPIALRNPGLLLDVTLAKGASFSQQVWNFMFLHFWL